MNPEKLKLRDLFCIKMRTADNPINAASVIEQIRKNCIDKEEEAIRLDGEFTAKGGYVYKEFKDVYPWVVRPFVIPEERGILINSIDPHDSTPHGVAWLWIDYEGEIETEKDGKPWKTYPVINDRPNLYTIAELFMPGTIKQLSEEILLVESQWNRNAMVRLCDPSAWNESQKDTVTQTTAQLFSDNGLHVIKGSKDMTGGNRKVRILMQNDDGPPRLRVFETCTRLRWEMVNYRYPDWRGRSKDEKKRPDKPIDKDDHIIEAQRRNVEYALDGNWQDLLDADEHPVLAPDGNVVDVVYDMEDDEDEIYDATIG